MADLEQLERAFMKAHKAGDKKAAAVLAKAVKQARTQVAEVTPAQPPEQLQNPFMGRSTDELIALSEQPGITPEQQQQIMDAASANELQPEQRDASPEAVRAFQQRKGQEFAGAAMGGLKQGFREFGAGAAQWVVPKDQAAQMAEDVRQRELELRKQYPEQQGVITGSKIVGQIAPLAGLPMGSAKTLGQAALQGAGYGALGGATQVAESGGIGEKLLQTAGGAAVGGVLPPALASAAKTGKVAARAATLGAGKALEKTGELIGSGAVQGAGLKVAGLMKPLGKQDEAAAIMKFAKDEGVDLAFTDVTNSTFARKLDSVSEKLGAFGMAPFRKKQHGQLLNAAKNLLDDLRPNGDAPVLLQESINKTATTFQQRAKQVFESVFDKADEAGGAVKVLNARNAAKNIMQDEVLKRQFADSGLLKEMDKLRLGGNFDMRTAHRIRSDLLDQARAARGENLTATKLSRAYEQVAKALDYDIGRYAVNKGLHKEWRAANKYFKDHVVPMRESMITRAGRTDMPDEILSKFIRTDGVTGKDRALKLYNATDQAGKDAAKYLMVERAFNKAGDAFSPAKFASELDRMEKATGIFFKGKDKARIEGFKNMMRAAEKAGQYGADPKNGQQLFLPLAAAGTFASPGATATTLGGVSLAKLLFTTDAGKRLLMSSAGVRPDSQQMKAVVRAMSGLGGAYSATEEQ